MCDCYGPCVCGWAACQSGYFVRPELHESSEQIVFPTHELFCQPCGGSNNNNHKLLQTLRCFAGQPMSNACNFSQIYKVGIFGTTVVNFELVTDPTQPNLACGIRMLLDVCRTKSRIPPFRVRVTAVVHGYNQPPLPKPIPAAATTKSFTSSTNLAAISGPLPCNEVCIDFDSARYDFSNNGKIYTDSTLTLFIEYEFTRC